MSGMPNKEGVSKVVALISKETVLMEKIADLTRDIDRAQRDRQRAETELATATKAREAEMSAMDLTQAGNYGHEHRMQMFLAELVRQTTASIPSRGEPA